MGFKYCLLLLIAMTCFVCSTMSTREVSDPAGEKHAMAGCLAAIFKFKPCIGEILHSLKTGKLDMSPQCCGKAILIAQQCWPKMTHNMETTTSICGLPSSETDGKFILN